VARVDQFERVERGFGVSNQTELAQALSRGSRRMPNTALGILLAGGGAGVISFDSLLVRLQALSPAGILFWRGLFSGVAFAILAAVLSRRAGGAGIRAEAGGWWPFVMLTAMMTLGTVTFVLAVTHTTVAHTLVIIASSPILTAVLGRILLGEKLPLRTWVAGFVVLAGVVVVFSSSLGGGQVQGDLWALVNTGSLALILILLRKYQQVDRMLSLAVSGLVIAAVLVPSEYHLPDTKSLLAAGVAGLVVLPGGLGMITFAPRHLPAAEVGLLLLLETILAPVWALLVVGEPLTVAVVVSGAIILAAISVHMVFDLKARPAAGLETLMPEPP
jgi:drug/metabolite transporter (DMT)-like permease